MIISFFFPNFDMELETHMKCYVTEQDLFLKSLFKKWEILTENVPKIGVFDFLKKIWLLVFFSIWSIIDVYFICSTFEQILYLEKILDSGIWSKMFLANKITAYLNQLYL